MRTLCRSVALAHFSLVFFSGNQCLFVDASQFCTTCDKYLRVKINYGHKYVTLHLVPVADIGRRHSMDHKIMTRTTDQGLTAILVIVESFSAFCHLIPVGDVTANTTSRAIVQHIMPLSKVNFCLQSDRVHECPVYSC